MTKHPVREKISCLLVVIFLLLMPILFMACSEPQLAVSHAPMSLDANPQETSLEKEVRSLMEKGTRMEDRKRMVPVIEVAFARLTSPARARNLAALCYLKTLGTPFTPLDLAEIALAETGGHHLSSRAQSPMGAVGVWQLMPAQARRHGYTAQDMQDDEKCADAAVRALASKLEVAGGNMDLAKKYYCGVGPQADHYLQKVRTIRRALMAELSRSGTRLAMNDQDS